MSFIDAKTALKIIKKIRADINTNGNQPLCTELQVGLCYRDNFSKDIQILHNVGFDKAVINTLEFKNRNFTLYYNFKTKYRRFLFWKVESSDLMNDPVYHAYMDLRKAAEKRKNEIAIAMLKEILQDFN